MGWPYLAQWPDLPVAFYTFKKKKKQFFYVKFWYNVFFFTLCLRVNFRTLSTLWVLCRFEREEVEDCCCTKRKHARLSVCTIVLKWEHQCRGTNVELFAYNDYVQLPASTLPTTLEIWVNVNTQSSVVSKISYFPSYDFGQNHSCDCMGDDKLT